MKTQFQIPWHLERVTSLPIAALPARPPDADYFPAIESDVDGILFSAFPLALFLRSLMAAAPEVRAFVLDAIGKDAPMVHFGLVELSQPKGGAREV